MRRSLAVVVPMIAVVVLAAGAKWRAGSASDQQPARARAARPAVGLIQTGHPTRRDFTARCPLYGHVQSRKTVKLLALAAGRIASIEAADETAVKKGVTLFTMGGPRVESRRATLKAAVASLHGRVALAERAVAMKAQALAEKVIRKDELISARDLLAQLRLELETAAQQFRVFHRMLRIQAPMDGIFTNRQVSAGQEVEAGTVLADMLAPRQLRIVARLFPPAGISLVGRRAVLYAGGAVASGLVTKVIPRGSPDGATLVWLESPQIDKQLHPGQSVRGEVVLFTHRRALAVPAAALVRDVHERSYVFVQTPAGYRKQAVKTGLTTEGRVEILEGLQATDTVVVRGGYELFYRNFNRIYTAAD